MELTSVPIADLVLDPNNARKHNKKNMMAIKKSLKEFKQYKNVVVQKSSMKVLAGNGTVQAASELGWDEISVFMIDVDDAKASTLAILDNRTTDLSEWDEDILISTLEELDDDLIDLSGFNTNDIKELLSDGDDEDKPQRETPVKTCPSCGHKF